VVFLSHFIEVLLLHLSTSSFQILPNPSFNPCPVETEQLMASSYVQQTYWSELAVVITVMNLDSVKRKQFLTENQLPVSQESLYHMKLAYTMLCLEWLIYSDVIIS